MSAGATTSKTQWPFSPQSIPGLSLWLDGADTSSITGTSPVTAWKDKSGKGNHASGNGGLSYTAGEGITFNGTNGYFTVPGVAGSIVGTPFTVFVVEKVAVLPSAGLPMGIFTNDPNANTTYGSFFTCYQPDGAVTFGWYNADQTTSTTYTVGTNRILNFNYTGTNRTILVNGTSGATQSWTQNLVTGAFTQPVIGRLWGQYYYNGTISELMLYIGNINTQQYQQVEGYLAQKWGLQILLPPTHPYYVALPFPTSISGLSLWLDGADTSTITGTSPVTAWRDKSVNGYSLTKASYSGGTITLSSRNGKSTVNLGSNVLTTSSFAATVWNTQFFVVSTDTWITSVGPSVIFAYVYTGNNQLYLGGNSFQDANISQGTEILSALNLTNKYCLLVIGYGGGTQASNYAINGTERFTTSGTSTGNGTINPGTALAQSTVTSNLWLNGNPSTSYGTTTNVAEILVYNNQLTASQRQQVEGYLAWKWGLQSSLPPSHPYYPTSTMKLYWQPVFQRAFSPIDIDGCSLWLDAADLSTITGTSTVTAWKDKSGNANNATATGSPTLSTAGGFGSSSPQTIYLNGSSYFLGSVNISSTTSLTAFVVTSFALSSSANSARVLSLASAGQVDWNNPLSSATFYQDYGTSNLSTYRNTAYLSAAVGQNTPVIGTCVYDGTSNYLYKNGASQTPVASTGTFAISIYGIGNQAVPSGELLNGYIGEVIVFNTGLTASQRQQVESYLAWKWGLVSPLTTGHPGKLLPSFSTTFTPKSLTGLQLWLDAADSSTITGTSTVTAWTDKSGNGYNMNSVPTNETSGPSVGTQINQLNTLFFSRERGLKQTTIINGVKNFYWVGRIATSPGALYFLLGADSTYDWLSYGGGPNGFIIDSFYAQAGLLAASPASQYTSGANAVVNTAFSNVLFPSAGQISLLSVAGITGNTRFQGVCYDRSEDPPRGWCGDLGEVLTFSNALTTQQHQQVEGYLAWKWGLQSNLPDTHAYKKFKP
jgi:hypothetical protein